MVDAKDGLMTDLSQYNVVIRDYGCLNKTNRELFLQSGVKILILGAKDWELGFSEEALELVSEYKDIMNGAMRTRVPLVSIE